MKKQRKKYERPLKPYDKERIENERKLKRSYGLRRKKEIRRAEAILRDFRRLAREFEANRNKEKESILLNKLNMMGLVGKDATLDDVLALTLDNLLDRRLQTIVYKRGIANTLKQSRQYIVHGHIALDGRRSRWPSIIVNVNDESKISFYPGSKVKETKLKKVTQGGKETKQPKEGATTKRTDKAATPAKA